MAVESPQPRPTRLRGGNAIFVIIAVVVLLLVAAAILIFFARAAWWIDDDAGVAEPNARVCLTAFARHAEATRCPSAPGEAVPRHVPSRDR